LGQLLRQFVDITLLQRGPEDLPVSRAALVVTIAAGIAISLLTILWMPSPAGESGNPVVLLAIDTALMLLWTRLVLHLARKPERFLQTATGLFGIQLVLSPLIAVGRWVYLRGSPDPQNPEPMATLLLFLVGLWLLIASARVLKSATGWATFACILLLLARALLAFGVLSMLYPEAAKAS
jgi:hypothetical protein